MTHPLQSMVNVDARNYPAHTERRNQRLTGTNHAGQISTRCRDCHAPMDVGWERFHTPGFRPVCFHCHTKETPCE